MQPIRDRLVSQLKHKGMPTAKANAIATSTLIRGGMLKKGSLEMTAKGVKRTAMGAAGRAKDRASKDSGHAAGDYKYNAQTNRATLK